MIGKRLDSRSEYLTQPLEQRGRILGLAFPNDVSVPTECPQGRHITSVSSNIARKFLLPKVNSRFGVVGKLAAGVTMPKTAVNEDHLAPFRERYIWRTRQFTSVQPKTIPQAMQK